MTEPMDRRQGEAGLDATAVLADPLRRRLLSLVSAAAEPVGRDDAASALGIGRSLAGYHLDLLAEEGLVAVTYARRSGRAGPGAGRPAKLYQRAAVEVTVQLPPRDDALVARLLAQAVEADPSGTARVALRKATREAGRALGRAATDVPGVIDVLAEQGYEPVETDEGIRLRNCPFHHLVGDHADLVCALNEDLLAAAVAESGAPLEAHLDPQPGRCCVVLQPIR